MARPIYVPQAGGFIEFSDDATDAEIVSYLKERFPTPPPTAVAAPPPAPAGPDDSGIVSRFAYGLATGLTDIPGGIAALMDPAKEAGETVGGRFSEGARQYLQETLGIDPTKEATTAQTLAQGVGSLGSFLIPGLGAAKGAGLLGAGAKLAGSAAVATGAAQGVAVGAEQRAQRIRDQLASGMAISDEEQLAAQRLSGLIGASEALPLGRFFKPLNILLSKIPASKAPIVEQIVKNRLSRIASAGIAEGAQEAASGIANDIMERGVYNPNVEIGQDLLSNAGTGAFAGSFLEGVIQLAAGRKLRASRQLAQDIESEAIANQAIVDQGELVRAAEQLRQYNVEGPVTIGEADIEGMTGYTIKAPSGNMFGAFTTPEQAQQAIDIYKKRTGAKISVREPVKAPSAFPVKIGTKKYKNIDEILADREKLLAERDAAEQILTTPDLLKKEAERQKVSEDFYKGVLQKNFKSRSEALNKIEDFISAADGRNAEETEAIDQPQEFTEEDFAPVQGREAIPEEMPIGAIEMPIEEQRYIEPAAPIETPVEAEAPEMELRPSATDEQLTDLKAELFGTPKNIRDMTPEERALYESERDKRYPPVEVDVSYDAGMLKTPRTLTEVEQRSDARKYTPEYQAFMDGVYTELSSRLSNIAPEAVSLKLRDFVAGSEGRLTRGTETPTRTPDGLKSVIELATGYVRPGVTVEEMVNELVGTLNHEVIHALRTQGLLRPAEWQMLSRAAAKTKVPGKKYTYLDKAQAIYEPMGGIYTTEDAVIEEAVAEMYKDWVAGKNRKEAVPVAGLFNRITEFLRRIFRTLQNRKYEDVFKQISAGEMRDREATPESMRPSRAITETDVDTEEVEAVESARFAAAPLPQNIAQANTTLFAPEPKEGFFQSMAQYFAGPGPQPKTLNTAYGQVDISKGKMRRIGARASAVDKNAFIAELEKLANLKSTGNYERMLADYSATAALGWRRRSSHINASMLQRGKLTLDYARPGDIQSATMKVMDDPDSMANIIKILMEPGPVDPVTNEQKDKREVFKSYAVAMRAKNKALLGIKTPNEVDQNYVNTVIPFTQQNYPEVVQAYEMYQRFNRNLLKTAKEAGLITDTELQNLTRNMDYYGFYREVFENVGAPGMPTKTASKFELRAMKGGEHGNLVGDPVYVMVHNAQFWVDSIAKNIAAQKSFKLAKDMGVARILGSTEKPDQARGEEEQVMFFRENGVQKRFAVSDPLLVMALGTDDRVDIGRFWQLAGMPTTVLRESVTRDPGFMVANLMRDTLSAWITSGEDITPFIGTIKGFAKAYKGSASFEALMGRGVVGSYDLAMKAPKELAADLRNRAMPKNVLTLNGPEAATAVIGGLWNRLGALSEYSDAATRIAVYEAARAQGLSEAEATFRAIEIMDFSRRGGSQALSILTKVVPFLNARIQGMDVLYQAGKAAKKVVLGQAQGEREANLGKKFLVRGAMLAAISVALEMMNDDDEDYQQLDDYIKTGNLLIPLKYFGLEGQFLAIPKPFEAGLLFSTFPQEFYKSMSGDASTRSMVNLFISSVSSTFGVNPIPQAILPALEIITNHDFYTGLPLISEGKARLAPELQYNSGTSQLAMMLGDIPIWYDMTSGKFEGLSPIVIDQIIGGYAGPWGTYIAQAVGMAMESQDVGPERLPRDITQLPVVRRFFMDAQVKNPKVVTQAYELFRLVDEANRSFSRLRQTGDAEAVMAYLEENKDVLSYKKYVFKLVDRLNKLSAHERQIERDQTMTREEKLEAMAKLREVRIRLASKVKEINAVLGR